MVLAGADICSGGVGVNRDAEDNIQWIVNTIKAISPPSSLNIRLPKSGVRKLKSISEKRLNQKSSQEVEMAIVG